MNEPRTRGRAASSYPPGESGVEGTPVAQEIRAAIHTVAPATMAESLLRKALLVSGREALPREAQQVEGFVRNGLFSTISATLSPTHAAAVVARLEPMLATLAGIEEAGRAPVAPAAATSRARARIVLLVGAAPAVAASLAAAAVKPMSVIPVHDAQSLSSGLELLRHQPRVVVLECRSAAQPLSALVALDPALLDDALVVLWGGDDAQRGVVSDRFPTARVIDCYDDATVDELVDLLSSRTSSFPPVL